MFQFGNMHVGPSYFYVSTNRCRTWRGPFSFAVQGVDKVTARTDLIMLGQHDCLMLGSAAKANNKEGRPFCARTTDGGLTWKLVAFIGPEPEGYAIMPSSLRLKNGALLTTIRHADPGKPAVIEVYRSDDLGQHWQFLGAATGNIGGNPPSLVRLNDGRLALTYGYRLKPFGARARISNDEGCTWGAEIILRDDGFSGDLGYPRSTLRADGKVVTVYYFNGPRDEDRTIQATIWSPPDSPQGK
ncbi:MAG: exo-alpha-sialidase [Verrucomicrobia bacterium]|nr:MAG: exo-alpha-sialidase [Verrucomicrobiota bacterium]